MNKSLVIIIGSMVLTAAAVITLLIWGVPYFFNVSLPTPTNVGFGSETVPARIVQILNQGTVNLGGIVQPYQDLSVEILQGQYKGTVLEVNYGQDQIQPEGIHFRPGDEILVVVSQNLSGGLVARYADAVRTRPILILLVVVAVSLLVVARWKGLRSLIALAISFLVVAGYIIPHILHGEDPVRVSIIGSIILLTVTLYLTYGWNFKTHAAVLALLTVLLITGLLAWLFIQVAFLTGNGDESALYLIQIPGIQVNLRGLFLGGMIIGALGVLDDLVITQASAVFELHDADPRLGLRALYKKGLRIGQDHVASTINTLVMAYTGVALPLLLLFTLESGNFSQLINVASVAEEIVRTLVGSLGLITAVPISTLIAAAMAANYRLVGELQPAPDPLAGKEVRRRQTTPPPE
jgi:uncharacterized membrane protein